MKTYKERSALVAMQMDRIGKAQRRHRRAVLRWASAAAVCLVIGLLLFYPYPDSPPSVAQYADSPYYGVITKVNALNYRPPEYANNFEWLWGEYAEQDKGEPGGPAEVPNGNQSGVTNAVGPTYEEVTDNQVAGVIEADLFKRSDRYLYYLHGDDLRVYEIAGEESKEVGSYRVGGNDGLLTGEGGFYYYGSSEMYLSQDCATVTLLLRCGSKTEGEATMVVNLDVTDPANIRQLDYVLFRGSLASTRMVGEKLLLVYNFDTSQADFDRPETFVPGYGKPGAMELLLPEEIYCPDTAGFSRFTVLAKLDSRTLAVEGAQALMGYSNLIYVSGDTVYVTQSYTEKTGGGLNRVTATVMSEISGISYRDGLEPLGKVTLEGDIRNQYYMDEHEGVLRVVTNTTVRTYREELGRYDSVMADQGDRERNVNLYCIDLSRWEVSASVLGFAPAGEHAESVRFDGGMGYVCTAEVITLSDPVYYFDLSDPEHITYTDTGTIDGYSSSLIQLGDGFLMGIGLGDRGQTKIEVYREAEDAVVSVAVWEEEADFSREYKSYLIDREKGLVGLALSPWGGQWENDCYLLLHFDGDTLNEMTRMEMNGTAPETVRACIVDGFLYVLDLTGLLVEKLR